MVALSRKNLADLMLSTGCPCVCGFVCMLMVICVIKTLVLVSLMLILWLLTHYFCLWKYTYTVVGLVLLGFGAEALNSLCFQSRLYRK